MRHPVIVRTLLSILVGLALGWWGGAFAGISVQEDDYPLVWSIEADRAECLDMPSYLWVHHAQGRDCVRYFSGNNLIGIGTVILLFTGDRDNLLKQVPKDIRNNTRRSQEAIAARRSAQAGVPVVMVARPGTYGSSGDHRHRRQIREFLILDAAVTTLRQRYGIQRFVLLGHSGGATAAAALLTLGRDDIQCAVLTSGAYGLLERAQRRAISAGRQPRTGTDTTGIYAPYDPLEHVDGIRPDPERRIYVLGSPLDKNTYFDLQKRFADAVAAAGHHVELREAAAKPPLYHDLVDGIGLKTAASCAH